MEYTINYFIDKFTTIPASKWCINNYYNNQAQHCALGFCDVIGNIPSKEGTALMKIFEDKYLFVDAVNDGDKDNVVFGNNPKERMLNALRIIKIQEQNRLNYEENQRIIKEKNL